MRAYFYAVLFVGSCLALVGCENELPPGQTAAKKLERGISGQGTIYQPDRSNDPMIREQSRTGN